MTWKEKLISKSATLLHVNLLGLSLKNLGIGLPSDFEHSGELKFIANELLKLIGERENYTFFDVGQNRGDYTKLLLKQIPNCVIHGFEPNVYLHETLLRNFSGKKNVNVNHIGLGKEKDDAMLHIYEHDKGTGHGSMYQNVLKDLHKNDQVLEEPIQLTTIKDYCLDNHICNIDFLKIDVEGHELAVLQGAKEMLSQIQVIQFEFNEMNIISRVFLKDFFDLLADFKFYRLTRKGLIALGSYSSTYEIFRIQNIIAVNKN